MKKVAVLSNLKGTKITIFLMQFKKKKKKFAEAVELPQNYLLPTH